MLLELAHLLKSDIVVVRFGENISTNAAFDAGYA